MWPAHEVLKKLGNAGLLGINKPVEYGGLGLDWKYNLAVLGTINIKWFLEHNFPIVPNFSL